MAILKRVRISGKIFLGVSCFICLGAVVTGFAAYNLYVLANSTQFTAHHAAAAVDRSVSAEQHMSRMHRFSFLTSDSNPDIARKNRELIESERIKLAIDLEALKPLLDADDMSVYQEVIVGVDRYNEMMKRLKVLALAGKEKEFGTLWDAEARGKAQAVDTVFYTLIRNSSGRLVKEIDAAHTRAQSSLAMVMSGALFGTLLILGFGLFLVKREIVDPLVNVTTAMKRLAEGDLSATAESGNREDEVGDLSRAFQSFRQTIVDKATAEADTEVQRKAVEEERRKNEEVLTALLEQQAFAVAAIGNGLEELAKGNLTCRLVGTFAPEFQKLQADFNRMTDEVAALVGQVQKSGIQVNTSMTEIAATSKEQQATASEIAATTTEVGATSKEIFATSKELVKTMNEVSTVAEQTASLASSGQSGLSRMGETMAHVMEAATAINSKLIVLNEKAGNINQVVTTISKVADQTNLLSLNAAIEAEKAGEYGRGFGVVAAEIRRLADQTGIATYDIEQMVKEIQSAISAGVMGMDKFSEEVRRGMQEMQLIGEQLSQIILQVQTLAPRFETVNEGMQAQATGAEQISEALLQLTESAQQTVESLRQSTLAIDDLTQVSGGLRSSVSRFKLRA